MLLDNFWLRMGGSDQVAPARGGMARGGTDLVWAQPVELSPPEEREEKVECRE